MERIHEVLDKVYNNKELRRTVVPLFMSNPGLGKSKIIAKFAKDKGVNMVELITSTVNPFEVTGMAMPDREVGKMTYFDFDNLLSLKDGDILFFDELLNGNPAVLNACLTILEQRRFISGKELPDIMIVAAANPQGAPILTPQIKERFIWYDLHFSKEMWIDFMRTKYAMPREVVMKLAVHIRNEDFKGHNLYTPRSIDKAVSMILAGVPTPYEVSITPDLETLVSNPLEGEVQINEEFTFGESEKIKWLELIKLINKNGKTTK